MPRHRATSEFLFLALLLAALVGLFSLLNEHFWSLAIEEQFYVVYPLLVVVALRFGGRRALTAVLTVLALASVAASFALSSDFDRVYYGTDTRAFELLAGALFALWWSAPERIGPGRLPPAVREALGAAGLLASLVAWYVVGQTSPRLARGGFALQALATVAVLVAVTAPHVLELQGQMRTRALHHAMGGNADPVLLAGGIGTALVTTFWGLLVAIPATSAYAMIRNRTIAASDEALAEVDAMLAQFRPRQDAAAREAGLQESGHGG